jgi:hypothetical protein
MPPQHSLDLVAALLVVLGLLFSPQLAAVLAPYLVVVFGALIGTGWGLKRRTAPTTLRNTVLFVTLMLGTCLIVTMPVAIWLQRYTGEGTYQWFLGPVAILIGAIGEDWPDVGKWAAGFVRRFITKRADAAADTDKGE